MRNLIDVCIIVAVVSLVLGIISRVTLMPFPPTMLRLEANALLRFTDTCLLLAIALSLIEILNKK